MKKYRLLQHWSYYHYHYLYDWISFIHLHIGDLTPTVQKEIQGNILYSIIQLIMCFCSNSMRLIKCCINFMHSFGCCVSDFFIVKSVTDPILLLGQCFISFFHCFFYHLPALQPPNKQQTTKISPQFKMQHSIRRYYGLVNQINMFGDQLLHNHYNSGNSNHHISLYFIIHNKLYKYTQK